MDSFLMPQLNFRNVMIMFVHVCSISSTNDTVPAPQMVSCEHETGILLCDLHIYASTSYANF